MEDFNIPKEFPTVNKTVRFSDTDIWNIEQKLKGRSCTFSAFIIEAARFTLRNLPELKHEFLANSKGEKKSLSTNKTIRLPTDVVAGIEGVLGELNCTFSAFIVEAARLALLHVKKQ